MQLDIKVLFGLKWEFSRRDIYSFSFDNEQELKFFIENLGIQIPDSFIALLYKSTVTSSTGKLNFVSLKNFIDVCQDTIVQQEKTSSVVMQALI